ncbi:MAG TPA: hypothetical protein EYP56_10750 [Planctomycetaceae bacterium]|nr:hypothetical protein [Planctomycetaceae bacterium]HIQ21433.1 hypothetical protein [Planctomycetota bacterium]
MDEPWAYCNGQYLPLSALAVSPTDAGFVVGATLAEQLRTFAGRIFRLEDHLRRLRQALDVVGIRLPVTWDELTGAACELVERNHRLLAPGDDLGLCIFVTPGSYAPFVQADHSAATVAMHTYPLPFRLWADKYEVGQRLVTTDIRQVPANCWPPSLKCRSRMHYYLADRRAAELETGARALLLDQAGCVCEASTANIVIWRRDEGLLTPPVSQVLPGISLAVAHQLAEGEDLPFTQRRLTADEVAEADEVILTSTPFCLLPVTWFNRRPVADGRPGPVFQRLLQAWNKLVDVDIAAQARRFAGR